MLIEIKKKQPHKALNKEKLSLNWMSYLNHNNLAVICQINKKFEKLAEKFNITWHKACHEFFCSSYSMSR